VFLGHAAVGLAAKSVAPRASLGTLLGAAFFLDLMWPLFLLAGLEEVRIVPGVTAVTPLDFVHYPYTHSLVAALLWGAGCASLYGLVRRDVRPAIVIGVLVVSHWLLDLIVHRPDLPLASTSGPRFGLGLWSSIPGTAAVELLSLAAGAAVYARVTRPRDGVGRWGVWAFLATLAALWAASLLGPPPPDTRSLAGVGLSVWILLLWPAWADRHREPARSH
jgi:membrane-bound metal-dependent hydrolase YbcI (DUF457 family)